MINYEDIAAGDVVATADKIAFYDTSAGGVRLLPLTSFYTLIAAMRLAAGQIAFPATAVPSADPNTLDDYEEGTWTPSLGGDATYTAQSGLYTKIGNAVLISGRIAVNVIGTGNTDHIINLPFTNNNTVLSPGTIGYYTDLAVNVYSIFPSTTAGSVTVYFHGQTALDGSVNPNLAIFQNAASLYFSIVYFI